MDTLAGGGQLTASDLRGYKDPRVSDGVADAINGLG